MSFLLPHLLEERDRRLEVYVTRVYNPVWTNPDGASWIRMLADERRVGCHVALTPIWSETAQWADWVLPTGLAPERHDLMSQETHAATWIGFRQPVTREHARRAGRPVRDSRETNPGEAWEEAELWIALTWRIDPDGLRGIRRFYESKREPGRAIGLDEYYGDIFDHAVPGLPEAARAAGLSPLDYMRRYGAYEVPYAGQRRHERDGFPTPSGKLELWSETLEAWGWTRCGCIPRMPRASGSSPAISCGFSPASVISFRGPGSPRGSTPGSPPARTTPGAGACTARSAASGSARRTSS